VWAITHRWAGYGGGVLRFSQIDVFASGLTAGNPLAVVHDADALSDKQMAAFARWTNLSETTFLLQPTTTDADYRVRIFTPSGELPFAGHPTLGSARAWLEAGGQPTRADVVVQECEAGLVRVKRDGERLAFAAPPVLRSGPLEPDAVARLTNALGLAPEHVIEAVYADNGPGWVALLLDSAERVLGLTPDAASFGEHNKVGVVGPYPDPAPGQPTFEVRAFYPGAVGEDPVTGSLNASVAQWLITAGHAPASYIASQGTCLGREGRVFIDDDGDDVWVGGHTVVGITGQVAL
jgi:PhzF family phenazine biosynthesis protein